MEALIAVVRRLRDGVLGSSTESVQAQLWRRLEHRHAAVFVSWIGHHGRSVALAEELGAEAIFVATGRTGNVLSAPARYILQTTRTLRILFRKHPTTIIVMAPPLPLVALTWLASKLMRSDLVIDAHTGVFNDPKWAWTIRTFLWFARRSRLTIVTNKPLADWLERAGVRAASLHDSPNLMFAESKEGKARSDEPTQDTVIVPCSFSSDEPIDAIVAAAKELPAVVFYLTGSLPRLSPVAFAERPANVVFTGYLPSDEYESLFASATMVMCLTTREYTMQRGGYEALSRHKPLLTSDTRVLREYFTKGTAFTSPHQDDIRAGIVYCLENRATLADGMAVLHSQKLASWSSELDRVKEMLQAPSTSMSSKK